MGKSTSDCYNDELKSCKNIPDELIIRRFKLYDKIDRDNQARIGAIRNTLMERYPYIVNFASVHELIEIVEGRSRKVGAANDTRTVQKPSGEIQEHSGGNAQSASIGNNDEVVTGREDKEEG